jgi:hypothetical protein
MITPYKTSFEEVRHLQIREKVSGAVAVLSTLSAIAVFTGVLAGGQILFGALMAIALISALYAYICREAGHSLHKRFVSQESLPALLP